LNVDTSSSVAPGAGPDGQEAAAVATPLAVPAQTSSRELLEQNLAALDDADPCPRTFAGSGSRPT
jgi:hypothetical protein